jgi:hypothetical protein
VTASQDKPEPSKPVVISFRKQVINSLRNLQRKREFTASGSCFNGLPGLTIHGIGTVPLPVTAFVAEQIKKVARPVIHTPVLVAATSYPATNVSGGPFKKPTQTGCNLADQAAVVKNEAAFPSPIPKVYEISDNLISIKHPHWNNSLLHVLAMVKSTFKIGDASTISAKLTKAVLYESEQTTANTASKPKWQTEPRRAKGSNEFATLVIQLPSEYEGGSFSLRYNDSQPCHKFNDSHNAFYESQYVAYYDAVEHCTIPVVSGYRFVLVYTLLWNDVKIPAPRLRKNADVIARLHNYLHSWSMTPKTDFKPIGILLENQYSAQLLVKEGTGAFNGHDADIWSALSSYNNKFAKDDSRRIEIYIARLKRVVKYEKDEMRGCGYPARKKRRYGWSRYDDWMNEYDSEFDDDDDDDEDDSDDCTDNYQSSEEFSGDDANGNGDTYWGADRWAFTDANNCIDQLFQTSGGPVPYAGSTGFSLKHLISLNPEVIDLKVKLESTRLWRKVADKQYESWNKTETYYRYALFICPASQMVYKILQTGGALAALHYLNEEANLKYYPDGLSDDELARFESRAKNVIDSLAINPTGTSLLAAFAVGMSLAGRLKSLNVAGYITKTCSWLLERHPDPGVYFHLEDSIIVTIQSLACESLPQIIHPMMKHLSNALFIYARLIRDQVLQVSPSLTDTIYTRWLSDPNRLQTGKFIEVFKTYHSLPTKEFNTKLVQELTQNVPTARFKEILDALISNLKTPIPTNDWYLRHLVSHRLNYLHKVSKQGIPPFDWRMPSAKYPGRPEIEAFLKSPQETFVVSRIFTSISQARSFEWEVLKMQPTCNFSVTCLASGVGKNAKVTLTKTRGWYDNYVKFIKSLTPDGPEGTRLRFLLCDPDSAPSAAALEARAHGVENHDAALRLISSSLRR